MMQVRIQLKTIISFFSVKWFKLNKINETDARVGKRQNNILVVVNVFNLFSNDLSSNPDEVKLLSLCQLLKL